MRRTGKLSGVPPVNTVAVTLPLLGKFTEVTWERLRPVIVTSTVVPVATVSGTMLAICVSKTVNGCGLVATPLRLVTDTRPVVA